MQYMLEMLHICRPTVFMDNSSHMQDGSLAPMTYGCTHARFKYALALQLYA